MVEPCIGEFHSQHSGVDTRQLEQVVDELTQRPHPVTEWRQVAVERYQAVLERFEHGVDRRQGRAQIV